MNVHRALSAAIPAALPSETPDAGSVAPAPLKPAASDSGTASTNADNIVDAFERSSARPTPPSAPLSVPPGAGAPISAAALQTQGAKALLGPIVVAEPITTERTPRPAPKDLKPVHVEVPWYSQFENHGNVKGGDASCNAMVKEMLRNTNPPVSPGGKEPASNINIAAKKDERGRIEPDPAKAAQGLEYINSQLDSGRPVMVGVMWNTPKPGKNDGNADHYVVITGRGVDAEGREYYTFHDPGTHDSKIGSDTRPDNRFYVDKDTGMLFRPLPDKRTWVTHGRQEVSQVRRNQEPAAPKAQK